MKSKLLTIVGVLALGAGIFALGVLLGNAIAPSNGHAQLAAEQRPAGSDHQAAGHEAANHQAAQQPAGHEHAAFEVPAGEPRPSVRVELLPDGHHGDGWNIHIITENFTFAPEHSSGPHIPGEGHAHIYINGVKIARSYGPWFHISRATAGRGALEITAALNTNDHNLYTVDGAPVEASAVVMSF